MIEFFLCSMVTILPDFLFRRYVQGKSLGKEITLYSVWFELRYGITACLFLTILLFTLVLYFHPSTTKAVSYFRTVPILPERSGRVEEVYVHVRDKVKAGQPIFKLDVTAQEAAVETARRKLTEIDAAIKLSKAQLVVSDAQIAEATSSYRQAVDELDTKSELMKRNSASVSRREIERLQLVVEGRDAAVAAATANKATIAEQISSVFPAQKESAQAALHEAQIDVTKSTVRAGVDGILEQFTLRKGDIVNPLMRPAGVLIPSQAGRLTLIAGFNQLEAQVIKPGMIAEVTCISKPMTIIPMVVTNVQGLIAAGQLRAGDQLVDPQQVGGPGTVLAYLEPLYENSFDDVPPGSSCIANTYTSNYDILAAGNLSMPRWLFLHLIDTVGAIHAIILRIQAILLPVTTLVFSGSH